MHSELRHFVAAALIASPAFAIAQTGPQYATAPAPHYSLQQLESAGYVPGDAEHYPQNLHAAERRLDARYARDSRGGTSAGSSAQGNGSTGQPADQSSLYKGP